MKTIPIHYFFTDIERDNLFNLLATIPSNPYTEWHLFLIEVQRLIKSSEIPEMFRRICINRKVKDPTEHPYIHLKNCPIDQKLPRLDWEGSTDQKYELKKTFVGEAFLVLFSVLSGTPILSYHRVCNGDYIRDVHPEKALMNSQSAKTMTSFDFHKEIPVRPTSPDYVNLLGLRNYSGNEIPTIFVKNKAVRKELRKVRNLFWFWLLSAPWIYQTPYSVLAAASDTEKKYSKTVKHAILRRNNEICYHQNRTTSRFKWACLAMRKLDAVLEKHKSSIRIEAGDFVSFANYHCLHGREVLKISNFEELKHRWLLKTFSAHRLKDYQRYQYDRHLTVMDQ